MLLDALKAYKLTKINEMVKINDLVPLNDLELSNDLEYQIFYETYNNIFNELILTKMK